MYCWACVGSNHRRRIPSLHAFSLACNCRFINLMGEQQSNKSFNFGDDINSTPISNLQMAPQMTSRTDSGAQPLVPPIYSPTVDLPPQQRHVSFQDPIDSDLETSRSRRKRSRSKRSHHESHHESRREPYYDYPQLQVPQLPQQQPKKKLFRLLHEYRHQIAIFVIVVILLWYYPRIAQFPYVGNGSGLTMLGLCVVPSGAALAYAGAEYVLE